MKVYLKYHKNPLSDVVAVCDESILGKVLKNSSMEISVSEGFYKGELVNIEKAIQILKRSNNFNIIGAEIVKATMDSGIISKDSLLIIDKVPLAMKISI